MSCSMVQHGAACGDRTQDFSIRSLMLQHYATALPLQFMICQVELPVTLHSDKYVGMIANIYKHKTRINFVTHLEAHILA